MQTDCMPTDLYGRTTMNHSVWCAWADMNWGGHMTSPVIVSALRAETVTQLLRREKEGLMGQSLDLDLRVHSFI